MTGSITRHLHKAGALHQAQTHQTLPNQVERLSQRQVVTQPSLLTHPYQEQQKRKKTRLTQAVTLSQRQVKR